MGSSTYSILLKCFLQKKILGTLQMFFVSVIYHTAWVDNSIITLMYILWNTCMWHDLCDNILLCSVFFSLIQHTHFENKEYKYFIENVSSSSTSPPLLQTFLRVYVCLCVRVHVRVALGTYQCFVRTMSTTVSTC